MLIDFIPPTVIIFEAALLMHKECRKLPTTSLQGYRERSELHCNHKA